MVECGGLENRFAGTPGNEGSNPSSSAMFVVTQICAIPTNSSEHSFLRAPSRGARFVVESE